MSRAGRPSLPANVHLLRGDPSKKGAAGLAEASRGPKVELPACPAFLGQMARQEWKRIAPHLRTAGLVTQLDRAALAGYCQAWGEWAQLELRCRDLLKDKGADGLIDRTPSGYRQVSALAQARDRAFDRMLRSAREFGLSPASRIQSTAGQQLALPGMPDDPMEGFLQAGAGVSAANTGGAA